MALSDDFDELIKPALRNEFEKDKINWFPRTDTKENKAFDKRKPGIFKEELFRMEMSMHTTGKDVAQSNSIK